jgi:uncharacterized paraquat-inducible protein A
MSVPGERSAADMPIQGYPPDDSRDRRGRETLSSGASAREIPSGAAPESEASQMSCEHLICAACAGPVDEGRCPTCRAARSHVHQQGLNSLPPAVIVAIVALAALMLLLISGHFSGL